MMDVCKRTSNQPLYPNRKGYLFYNLISLIHKINFLMDNFDPLHGPCPSQEPIPYGRHVKLVARGPHADPLLVLCGPNSYFLFVTIQ